MIPTINKTGKIGRFRVWKLKRKTFRIREDLSEALCKSAYSTGHSENEAINKILEQHFLSKNK